MGNPGEGVFFHLLRACLTPQHIFSEKCALIGLSWIERRRLLGVVELHEMVVGAIGAKERAAGGLYYIYNNYYIDINNCPFT